MSYFELMGDPPFSLIVIIEFEYQSETQIWNALYDTIELYYAEIATKYKNQNKVPREHKSHFII